MLKNEKTEMRLMKFLVDFEKDQFMDAYRHLFSVATSLDCAKCKALGCMYNNISAA